MRTDYSILAHLDMLFMLGLSNTPTNHAVECDDAEVVSDADNETDDEEGDVRDGSDLENDSWLVKSLERCEKDDPDFVDNDEMDDSILENSSTENRSVPIHRQCTYVVFESCLVELFKYCNKCGAPLNQSVTEEQLNMGSQLSYRFQCVKGCEYVWSSQPKWKGTKGVGNLLLTAAIELSGSSFTKVRKFANLLNLKFIGKSTYYEHRGNYVYPEINRAWLKNQEEQVEEIFESGRSLELAVDGQCDSPGHNATYSTVSAIDTHTNKLLDFKIVHVKEVTSSQAMEKKGFVDCIDAIQETLNLPIRVISTDRHASIKKLMRTEEKYKHIIHQFDPWHIGKGCLKKLIKASKKKDLKILARWAQAVVNHMYWSIATCGGNGKELAERFTSIVHHAVNKHVFPHNKFYKKCDHPPLSTEDKNRKEWLVMGSAAHEALIKVVTQPLLVKDLEQMTEQINTTLLEVFHSLKIRYLPKSIFFKMEKMIAGTQLAILDHNNNVNREQKCTTDKEGTQIPLFKIAYSKPNRRFVAKTIKEDKNYDYLTYIIRKVMKRSHCARKASNKNRLKRKSSLKIAPDDRPPKEEIIENALKYKRIKL